METYVCNPQRSKIIPIAVLATHLLTLATATSALIPQRRWDIGALLADGVAWPARTACHRIITHTSGNIGRLTHGCHGLLVRAASGEMLSTADTTGDGLVLELLLHALGVGVLGLILGLLLPVGAGTEDDVLAHRGGIVCGAGAIAGRQTELGPLLALGDTGVDDLTVCNEADTAGSLDGLSVLVEVVGDDGLGTVAVLDGLLWGDSGGGGGHVLDVVIVGPVSAVHIRGLIMMNSIVVQGRKIGCASPGAKGNRRRKRWGGNRNSEDMRRATGEIE